MRKLNKVTLFCLSLNLVACATYQQTNYYLLTSMAPVSQKGSKSIFSAKEITVLVKPVKFAEYLNQPQMVVRENEYKFQLNEFNRWAEPLKDNFSQVFVENLNARIAPGNALTFSETGKVKPSHQLSVEVLRLDVNTNNQVVLRVNWAISLKNKPLTTEKYKNEFTIPVEDKSHEAGVETQSIAIALFADQVAESILKLKPLE